MNVRQRVVKGVLWSAGLSFATQAASFIMSFLLARVLGKQTFGEWGMIQTTIGSVAQIAQLSMAVTATKYVAELRHKDPGRVGRILGLCSAVTLITGGVATLGLLAFSGAIAADVLHAPHLARGVRLSAGFLFFLTINGYQIGALSGLEAFRRLAAAGAIYGAMSTTLVVLLGYFFGLDAALGGMSLAAAVNWAIHHLYLTRYCREHGVAANYRGLGEELAVLTGFTIPATLSGIVGSLGVWLSTVILVQAARGYEQMAVLSAAMTFRTAVLFAPTVISRVSTPLLVNLSGNVEQGAYQRVFTRNLLVLSGAAVAVAAPLALLAPWLLLAFGRNYEEGTPVVALLALATVFEVIVVALYQQIYATGSMWSSVAIAALRGALLVAVSAVLAPRLGALGVAWANAVAYGGSLVLTWAMVRSKMPAVAGLR